MPSTSRWCSEPRDVSDALVEYAKRREARVQEYSPSPRRVAITGQHPLHGWRDDVPEVLDSTASLSTPSWSWSGNQRDELLAVVRLYKALRGGWQE
jgi:hypothetical protein